MSIYIIPTTQDNCYRRSGHAGHGRCAATVQGDPFRRSNAIPRPLFSGAFSSIDDVIGDDEQGYSLNPWRQHQLQQILRRSAYVEEMEHRQRILQARQHELERARRERERAARAAWHREQQQRAAVLEYQRRRQLEFLERERLAKRREVLAARAQNEWDQFATQALYGMVNFAQQLFGDEEEEEEEGKGNQPESSSHGQTKKEPVAAQTAEAKDEGVKMQMDGEEHPAVEDQTPTTTQKDNSTPQPDRLLFTYPLPLNESARSNIRAQDIQLSYDESSRTIQLKGLWSEEADSDGASSTVASEQGAETESRGRKRSRSPKRSRVSDVDEQTGEEISKPEDEEQDGFVEVGKPGQENKSGVTKSLRLPEDANAKDLRAEINDDGFQLWVR